MFCEILRLTYLSAIKHKQYPRFVYLASGTLELQRTAHPKEQILSIGINQ